MCKNGTLLFHACSLRHSPIYQSKKTPFYLQLHVDTVLAPYGMHSQEALLLLDWIFFKWTCCISDHSIFKTHLYHVSTTLITQQLQYHLLIERTTAFCRNILFFYSKCHFLTLRHFFKHWIFFFFNMTGRKKTLITLLRELLYLLL